MSFDREQHSVLSLTEESEQNSCLDPFLLAEQVLATSFTLTSSPSALLSNIEQTTKVENLKVPKTKESKAKHRATASFPFQHKRTGHLFCFNYQKEKTECSLPALAIAPMPERPQLQQKREIKPVQFICKCEKHPGLLSRYLILQKLKHPDQKSISILEHLRLLKSMKKPSTPSFPQKGMRRLPMS